MLSKKRIQLLVPSYMYYDCLSVAAEDRTPTFITASRRTIQFLLSYAGREIIFELPSSKNKYEIEFNSAFFPPFTFPQERNVVCSNAIKIIHPFKSNTVYFLKWLIFILYLLARTHRESEFASCMCFLTLSPRRKCNINDTFANSHAYSIIQHEFYTLQHRFMLIPNYRLRDKGI